MSPAPKLGSNPGSTKKIAGLESFSPDLSRNAIPLTVSNALKMDFPGTWQRKMLPPSLSSSVGQAHTWRDTKNISCFPGMKGGHNVPSNHRTNRTPFDLSSALEGTGRDTPAGSILLTARPPTHSHSRAPTHSHHTTSQTLRGRNHSANQGLCGHPRAIWLPETRSTGSL